MSERSEFRKQRDKEVSPGRGRVKRGVKSVNGLLIYGGGDNLQRSRYIYTAFRRKYAATVGAHLGPARLNPRTPGNGICSCVSSVGVVAGGLCYCFFICPLGR